MSRGGAERAGVRVIRLFCVAALLLPLLKKGAVNFSFTELPPRAVAL